mgnify:CR=1 FL=1
MRSIGVITACMVAVSLPGTLWAKEGALSDVVARERFLA